MFEDYDPDAPKDHRWLVDYVLNHMVGVGPGDINKIRDVVATLAEEIHAEDEDEDSPLLFCGSDGKRVIKCLHFPEDVLGAAGPVLLPSAKPNVILAAYSDEFLHVKVEEIEYWYPDRNERDQQWELYLNGLGIEIAKLVPTSAPAADPFAEILENSGEPGDE